MNNNQSLNEAVRVLRLFLVVGGTMVFLHCGLLTQAFLLCLIGIYIETWGRR